MVQIERKCEECNTIFYPYNNSSQKTCSTECRKLKRLKYNRIWTANKGPEYRRSVNKKYKESKPATRLYNGAKSRAKRNNLEFNLTVEWIKTRMDNGYCEVTGIKFSPFSYGDLSNSGWSSRDKHLATIDKIDPNKGYTVDNCRLVVWIYNLSKGTYSDSDVLDMAYRLVERNQK